MVKTLVFTHSLSLALRLVDTTTGRNISGRGFTARADGTVIRFSEKADGVLIFQNLNSRSFRLELTSPAYEKAEMEVDLDGLDKALPLVEVHLIPSDGYPGVVEFLTLEGTLPGIGELSAVRMGDNACLIREFDPQRRMVTLFNPHHLELDRVFYALVDPDRNIFEPFRILRRVNDQTIKVDRVLEMSFRNYFPISAVVFGRCDPNGGYRLRVRDDGAAARWLIRWTVGGEVRFRVVDFREIPYPKLE